MRSDDDIRADVAAYEHRDDQEALGHLLDDVPVLLARAVRAEAERDAAQARIDTVKAAHSRSVDGRCTHDGHNWPCFTRRALGLPADTTETP